MNWDYNEYARMLVISREGFEPEKTGGRVAITLTHHTQHSDLAVGLAPPLLGAQSEVRCDDLNALPPLAKQGIDGAAWLSPPHTEVQALEPDHRELAQQRVAVVDRAAEQCVAGEGDPGRTTRQQFQGELTVHQGLHLLQCHDVRVDFIQHGAHPLGVSNAIAPHAAMDVVGRNLHDSAASTLSLALRVNQ